MELLFTIECVLVKFSITTQIIKIMSQGKLKKEKKMKNFLRHNWIRLNCTISEAKAWQKFCQ